MEFGRGVVEVIARMVGQPSPDLGMFVGAVVVRDRVNLQPARQVAVEMFEKPEKFLFKSCSYRSL
jgi:hypothetical protein